MKTGGTNNKLRDLLPSHISLYLTYYRVNIIIKQMNILHKRCSPRESRILSLFYLYIVMQDCEMTEAYAKFAAIFIRHLKTY